MSANVVRIENSKRHNTLAEIEAAKKAEAIFAREKIRLQKPINVKNDALASRMWNTVMRRTKGISLFDDLDSDVLGQYCCIAARVERLGAYYLDTIKRSEKNLPEKVLARLEAAERLMLTYAGKLGMTPESRVRLAKRQAGEQPEDDPDIDLYGD